MHFLFFIFISSRGIFTSTGLGKGSKEPQAPCTTVHCTQFLHKPSIPVMKEKDAEIPGVNMVYTDSAYYFDRLFCFVLFCFVLFCFVLFCFVLFCFSRENLKLQYDKLQRVAVKQIAFKIPPLPRT